MSLQKFVS